MQLSLNKQYLLATAMLFATTNILAKEISYDYLQIGYESLTDSSIPNNDVKGDAFGIEGSFGVAQYFALTARYATASFDRVLGVEVDAKELIFGVTGHTAIANDTDVFGNLSIIKGDVEASNGFDDDDTGNIISVGLRHNVTEKIELNINVSRVDIFDDTTNSIGVGARYYVSNPISLGIGYDTSDDLEQFFFNVRYDFK